MSTLGAVEEAIQELDRASERLGYAMEHANRPEATPADQAAAAEAARRRKVAREGLYEAMHAHTAAQYRTGLDMGQSQGRT